MKPGLHPWRSNFGRRLILAGAYEDALERLNRATDAAQRLRAKESADEEWLRLYRHTGAEWAKYVLEERRRRAQC